MELLKQGYTSRDVKRAADEAVKPAAYRAGNSGALSPDGEPIGACPRLALLRFYKIEHDAPDLSSKYMMDGGVGNEDLWVKVLTDSGLAPAQILQEEQLATSWNTSSGVPVTGRPDIGILDNQGRLARCLELKQASSLWTGRAVLGEGKPKDSALLQAAHYFWQVNEPGFHPAGLPEAAPAEGRIVEYEIWYVSRSIYPIGRTFTGIFRKLTKGLRGFIEWADNSDAEIKSLRPFKVGYRLDWNTAGQLIYQRLDIDGTEGPWETTLITKDSIRSFYEHVDSSRRLNKLPKRISKLDAKGNTKSYRDCKYCPLAQVCDKSETKGLDVWLNDVKSFNEMRVKAKEVNEGFELTNRDRANSAR